MKKSKFCVLFLVIFCATQTAHAEWLGHATGQYEFNSNLSNAQLPVDRVSDSVFVVNLSGGKYFQLTNATGLSMTADLGGSQQLQYTGLNHLLYGASTSLRHKFGLGNFAPWVSASGSVAYHTFENRPRDGWRYHLSAAMGKQLTERLSLQFTYRYDEHRADKVFSLPGLTRATFDDEDPATPISGDAFSLSAHHFTLTSIFAVSEKLTSHIAYTHREGGVTSTVNYNPDLLEYGNAVAIDRAFGNDRYAYRVNASSNLISVGLSWAVTGHAALNLGYDWIETHGTHGLLYSNHLVRFNLMYNFE